MENNRKRSRSKCLSHRTGVYTRSPRTDSAPSIRMPCFCMIPPSVAPEPLHLHKGSLTGTLNFSRRLETASARRHLPRKAKGALKPSPPLARGRFRWSSPLRGAMSALLALSFLSLLSSCATPPASSQPPKAVSAPAQPVPAKPKTELYQWQEDGRRVSRIEVDLDKQKAFFYAGRDEIGWTMVSAGVRSTPTPVGKFKITEKVAKKRSNRYGKIYDRKGNLVVRNAAIPADTIPKGGRFVGAPMPYFMRLTSGGVGLHGGPIPRPGRPASHGCIRVPTKFAPILYRHTAVGTPVRIIGGPADKKYAATWTRKRKT